MLDKTYRPDELEPKRYRRWEASGAFACSPDSKRPAFAVCLPPPNVTGNLHIGHALNATLQDVVVRYRRMQGYDVLWQPGVDHAGIATQMVVERQLEAEGLSRQQLGRKEFIARVWRWKEHSGGAISQQLRRLGASADWLRERFTMDEGLSRAVVKTFVTLYQQRLIFRGERLVNWDPKLQTAISDLEIEQREIEGHLWYVRYQLEQGGHVVIATTRPETMLGDSALAVHPDSPAHRDLVGSYAILPLVGRRLPVIADPAVDPELGSGVLKVTPAHDFKDFDLGRRHNLELINILAPDGSINDSAPERYRGLDRYQARDQIVAELEQQGLLERVEKHIHSVPHGDRSGVAIEPRLTIQWYLDTTPLAGQALAAVKDGRTVFVPKSWEKTYFEWLRELQPWCISRQIWWGHQIPAWYARDGRVFVAESEDQAQQLAEAHYGAQTTLTRDPDVLDTWFSSALWPFSTLGWPDETPHLHRYYPGCVLVTAFDIIFFWVARMMMMGLHFRGEVPFRKVYIHALVRDERGQKMAKSRGNVIDPLVLIEDYGCDALRMTLTALATQGCDINLSAQQVKGYRNFATKLWNAARYCQLNGCLIPDSSYRTHDNQLTVNRWIVSEVVALGQQTATAIEEFRFNEVASELYRFIWGVFCDWYLECTKSLLAGSDEATREEIRATTGWVLGRLVHYLHPVMPFICEEIWERLGGTGQLIVAEWPEYDQSLIDPEATQLVNWMKEVVSGIRNARAEMKIPPESRPLAGIEVATGRGDIWQWFKKHNLLIRSLAQLGSLGKHVIPKPGIKTLEAGEVYIVGGVRVDVDIGPTVVLLAMLPTDKEYALACFRRDLDKLNRATERVQRELDNPNFLNRAPADVVAERRERYEALQNSIRRKQESMKILTSDSHSV